MHAATATTLTCHPPVQERRRSFAFGNEPLLRVVVVIGLDVMHIIETRHHCILDGWSGALLQDPTPFTRMIIQTLIRSPSR